MLYKNIIQGTDEWKEIRYRKVGGSSSDKIMSNLGKPVENNAIFFDLLGEFMEPFDIEEERFLSADVRRGIELEPIARDEFARIYCKQVFEIGWSESSDFTGISPDGIIGDEKLIKTNLDVKEAFETKCPSRTTYAKYLIDNSLAITDYAWQIVDYFKEFPKLELLNLFIYRHENTIKSHILIKITRDMIIVVDKKKIGIIADLCIELADRQNEIKEALLNRIEDLKKPINNY